MKCGYLYLNYTNWMKFEFSGENFSAPCKRGDDDKVKGKTPRSLQIERLEVKAMRDPQTTGSYYFVEIKIGTN